MKALVINHYASNKGDRAVLYFVVRELGRNKVNSITVSGHDRKRWRDTKGSLEYPVKFVPWGINIERPTNQNLLQKKILGLGDRLWKYRYLIGRGLILRSFQYGLERLICNSEFLKAVKDADLVISTGGHHVTSLLAHDAVSDQIFDMGMVILSQKPLVLWSQSIGPLEFKSSKNRDFVRFVLSEASKIIIRDSQSFDLLDKFGIKRNRINQTFESVIGLNDLFSYYELPSEREKMVGISIYATQKREVSEHTEYVNSIAALIDHSVQKGYKTCFFPMELKDGGSDDRPLIYEIVARAKYGSQCIIEDEDMDTPAHLAKIAKCRAFVGNKTHSVIFALTAGTPLIALAYHKKTEDFMTQYELSRYCIPDTDLTKDRLLDAFDKLNSDLDSVGMQEFEKSREYGEIVRRDFSQMLKAYSPLQV